MNKPDSIMIDEVKYIRAESVRSIEDRQYIDSYKIIRSKDAGVFFGKIESVNDSTVRLSDARRIWYWDGAASLSQLAIDGTSKPENCKFPEAVNVTVFGVCEILDITEKAFKSLSQVKIWKK